MTPTPSNPEPTDDRLARCRVAVVGAGRIGGELIRHLALMGVGHVEVFERDRHVAEALRHHHAVHEGDFWDCLTLDRLRTFDFAVGTIDDPEARTRLNQKCLVANVNLLQVWTEDDVATVGAYPFGSLDDCACYECAADRAAVPMPIASLKLTVEGTRSATPVGVEVTTAGIAGALAVALLARIAAGSHGRVARRASIEATSGAGRSIELLRDPDCPRCGGLVRPVAIVHTRNSWVVSPEVAQACPETLDEYVQLSDAVEGLAGRSFRVGELAQRYRGRSIPVKFALTTLGGRAICLDFEDLAQGQTQSRTARSPAKVRRTR
jgi:hypothetical protein